MLSTINARSRSLFMSPPPAGRRITAGFTWMQRIGKSASFDVWFPDAVREAVEDLLAQGKQPGPDNFPAEWAAVRQFELLQEAGNYKIYDLDITHITRTLEDITRSMRSGGYRVTVATIGSYAENTAHDELEILDGRLQERIASMINMLYLEEQSGQTNSAMADKLHAGNWDYQNALPHIGVTLGAGRLFRRRKRKDEGTGGNAVDMKFLSAERRLSLAQQFFDILATLPQKHIRHDTAIGLQLPDANSENEWIYVAPEDETLRAFNSIMDSLFEPFNKWSLSGLHERPDATAEIKASNNHLRGYGDRLRPDADNFYRGLAGLAAN
jgi:hypothetical protein